LYGSSSFISNSGKLTGAIAGLGLPVDEAVGVGDVGDAVAVVDVAVVGVAVGETLVVSITGIERLLVLGFPQAVNKPVAIADSNKIDSLRDRNIKLRNIAF